MSKTRKKFTCSTGEWINNCVYSYNGILLSNGKERSTDSYNNVNEYLKH